MGRKTTLWAFQTQKTWTWLRKGNFKRETESLIIATQNNAIKTNHIKARIDKTHRLYGDRDESINHIISKCNKLAQKEYNTRHYSVGKVIHWEMCKKLKFDHTNKWYMHNSASVQEKDKHKHLWNFDIQTDHLILARWPDLIINKKKKRTCKIVDFAVPADQRIKLKECEKDKYLDLPRELKKQWNMKVTIIPIVIGAFGTVTKGLLKGTGGLGSWRTSRDHPNYCIIENGHNTEKSHGDLRRLTVTQTPWKDHRLTLMWKTPSK